jgi:integrase
MMPNISEKIVSALPTPDKGNRLHYFSGATLQGKRAPPGFAVRVTAAGTKSFVLFHRVNGKGYLETLGRWDENPQGGTLTVREAIIKADKLAKDLNSGRREDPRPERTRRLQDGDDKDKTIGGLLDSWLKRHVRANNLRSADEIENIINRLLKPNIGDVGIYEIKRRNVVAMLDTIADENGPRMADLALGYFRGACNWYTARDDDFVAPIARGMARLSTKDRARSRILDDDELRSLWRAVEKIGGDTERYIKALLLTACRRNEVSDLDPSEISGNQWVIPASRYKNKQEHVIPLVGDMKRLLGDGFKVSNFAKVKQRIDAELDIPHWTFHDLRRSARSLMSRAGVDANVAERCLGHAIQGVRGTYDRHEYLDEKRAAFEALAALVDRILNPIDNIVGLRG